MAVDHKQSAYVEIKRRFWVDQMWTLEEDAETRYTPLLESPRAVIEPDALLSEYVDDLVQSVRETVTISIQQSRL